MTAWPARSPHRSKWNPRSIVPCAAFRRLYAAGWRYVAVGRRLLRLQFGWIKHSDQISCLHWRAFIDQQFLNAAFNLRADDHLVGVNGADQYQVARVVSRKKIVGRGNHKNNSEKNEESGYARS